MIRRMKKGLKARPHDLNDVMNLGPQIVEIHASDEDLKKDLELNKKYDVQGAFHLPEYDGTTLLDIASLDESLRLKSVKFYQKAIDKARDWGTHFNGTPKVIIHPGGWSSEPMKHYEKSFLYDSFKRSWKEFNKLGISLMVENMPPFPWFYGGRWHCNIFTDPKDARDYCIGNGFGFCLDICHLWLYCQSIKEIDFMQALQFLRPIIGHIHLSDAKGVDGEGLQIGEGEMPIKEILRFIAPIQVGVVLECWQGHKSSFQGFKNDWAKIEQILKELEEEENVGVKLDGDNSKDSSD